MTPKELEQYVKVMKRTGCPKLTIGNIVIELDLSFKPTAKADQKSEVKDVPALSDEELLYWSASGNN